MFEDFNYAQTRCFTLVHKIILGIINEDLASELHFSTAFVDTINALERTPICWASLRDDPKTLAYCLHLLPIQTWLTPEATNIPFM